MYFSVSWINKSIVNLNKIIYDIFQFFYELVGRTQITQWSHGQSMMDYRGQMGVLDRDSLEAPLRLCHASFESRSNWSLSSHKDQSLRQSHRSQANWTMYWRCKIWKHHPIEKILILIRSLVNQGISRFDFELNSHRSKWRIRFSSDTAYSILGC